MAGLVGQVRGRKPKPFTVKGRPTVSFVFVIRNGELGGDLGDGDARDGVQFVFL